MGITSIETAYYVCREDMYVQVWISLTSLSYSTRYAEEHIPRRLFHTVLLFALSSLWVIRSSYLSHFFFTLASWSGPASHVQWQKWVSLRKTSYIRPCNLVGRRLFSFLLLTYCRTCSAIPRSSCRSLDFVFPSLFSVSVATKIRNVALCGLCMFPFGFFSFLGSFRHLVFRLGN